MRLVCPNCSAQYEIDASMIPDEGRDVQCSNCGHTWFELPGPADTAQDASSGFAETEDPPEDFGSMPYGPDEEDAFDEAVEDTLAARVESRPTNLSRADFEDAEDEFSPPPKPAEDSEETPPDDTDATEDDTEDAFHFSSDPEPAASTPVEEVEETPEIKAGADEPEDPVSIVSDASQSADDAKDDEDEPSVEEPPKDDWAIASAPRTPRRPADMAALDILREEAERELSQRRTPPSQGLETQTDLGLEDIRNRRTPSRALRARMAHLGEDAPENEEEHEDRVQSRSDPNKSRLVSQPDLARHQDEDDGYEEPRRDLLPDIEEINSTLKAAPHGARDPEAVRRSGFRVGFLLMIFLACAAIFAYAQAPAIARALPETETTLISYVDWANGLRDRIDALIRN